MSRLFRLGSQDIDLMIERLLPEVAAERRARESAVKSYVDEAVEVMEDLEYVERWLRKWMSAIEGDTRLASCDLTDLLTRARADAELLSQVRKRWGKP